MPKRKGFHSPSHCRNTGIAQLRALWFVVRKTRGNVKCVIAVACGCKYDGMSGRFSATYSFPCSILPSTLSFPTCVTPLPSPFPHPFLSPFLSPPPPSISSPFQDLESESIHSHLSSLARHLSKAVSLLRHPLPPATPPSLPEALDEATATAAAAGAPLPLPTVPELQAAVEKEHRRALARKVLIERRKEEAEREVMEKVSKGQGREREEGQVGMIGNGRGFWGIRSVVSQLVRGDEGGTLRP